MEEERGHETECQEETHSHEHGSSCRHSHKETLTHKMRENPWVLATVALGILSLILIIGSFSGGKILSENAAGKAVLDFANAQVEGEVELIDVADYGNSLYEVTIDYNGQEVPLYITKDGETLVQGVYPLKNSAGSGSSSSSGSSSQAKEIPQTDKPLVELFVMTHCPFGTQAEKGFIPAIKELGNTIDAKVRFVHYFMHGDVEETETYRQLCIREEQKGKYLAYLECFLEGDGKKDSSGYIRNGNDPSVCMKKLGIDESKVEDCMSNGNAEDYYAEDSALSKQYGVQGSPTLVINGVQSNAGRDAASYLEGICGAFSNSPEKCSSKLSDASPTPYFGWEGSSPSSNSDSLCG